jgi:hypothetical protein
MAVKKFITKTTAEKVAKKAKAYADGVVATLDNSLAAVAKSGSGADVSFSSQDLESTTVSAAIAEVNSKVAALPSAIVPKGTRTFSQLAPATDLAEGNVGNMWNISDGFTTTADFVEGAGNVIPAGANVYVANPSTGVYKYDIFQGMVDLSPLAVKAEMSVEAGTGDNADKTTITLKTGTAATVLTQHQDITGKVDKVQGKGLSTNDYDDTEKAAVAAAQVAADIYAEDATDNEVDEWFADEEEQNGGE